MHIRSTLRCLVFLCLSSLIGVGHASDGAAAAEPATAGDVQVTAAAPACRTGLDTRPANRPVIGLVLSGGGARGAAHIGVLKVIEEMGIPVDLVVGTSMGSIIGALYASGTPVSDIDRIVRETNWYKVLNDGPPYRDLALSRKREKRDFQLGGRLGIGPEGMKLPTGFSQGQNVQLMLRALTRHVADVRCFHDLAIPFAAVATDAATGEAVVLDRGDIVTSLRASMAIPAYFTAVEIDGRLLLDGGPANNMPVSIARRMGADIVIAIDISTPYFDREQLRDMFSISMQMTTILARRAADEERLRMRPDDLLIVPKLDGVETLDFDGMPAAVEAGERAARETLAGWRWAGHSTPAQRPSVRFSDRYISARKPVRMGRVTVSGEATLPHQQIIDRFALGEDDPLDDATLHRAITRVYGLDYFSTVDYERVSSQFGDNIHLKVQSREWGPTYLQFGLGLYDNFDGITRYTLGASLTATQVNQLTGQFNLQANLGSVQRLFGEFYQPVTVGAALFVAPWALIDRHDVDVAPGGQLVARLRAATEEAGLDFGWAGRHGELRFGYALGSRHLNFLIGVPAAPTFSTATGYLRISGELDRHDERDFPTRGSRLQTLVEYGRPGLGSDDAFDHVLFSATQVKTWQQQHMLFGLSAETLDVDGGLLLEPSRTGGPLALTAFNPGELTGDNAASLRLLTYRRMNNLPIVKFYAGGGLEFGGAWNGSPTDVDPRQLWPVATFFAGLSTPIGPIMLAAGFSENNRSAVHFQLGYRL
jgi:NTE family protein